MRLRSQAKGVVGLFEVITHTTLGKWWFSLETPAKNHRAACTAIAPAKGVGEKAKQTAVTQ